MSALRRKLPILGVFGSAALFAFSLPASAVTFPDAASSVGASVIGPDLQEFSSSVTGTTFSNTSAGTPADPEVTSSGTASANPSPNIKGTVSAAGVATSGTANESALLNVGLTYYFEITGPHTQLEVLGISGNGLLSGTGTGFIDVVRSQANSDGSFTGPQITLASACVEPNCGSLHSGPTLNLSTLQVLTSNTIYAITLGGSLTAAAGQTETMTLDPIFDTSLLDTGFNLELSANVGNELATSDTPLPATLPLFATGLGAMGLLARRRKWKTVATA